MPAQFHIHWASAVDCRTHPPDSGWPSWLSLCSGTPNFDRDLVEPDPPAVRARRRSGPCSATSRPGSPSSTCTSSGSTRCTCRRTARACGPDTRCVLTTVPSSSTAHTCCWPRSYTTRRPVPGVGGQPGSPGLTPLDSVLRGAAHRSRCRGGGPLSGPTIPSAGRPLVALERLDRVHAGDAEPVIRSDQGVAERGQSPLDAERIGPAGVVVTGSGDVAPRRRHAQVGRWLAAVAPPSTASGVGAAVERLPRQAWCPVPLPRAKRLSVARARRFGRCLGRRRRRRLRQPTCVVEIVRRSGAGMALAASVASVTSRRGR